jgi:hypothetical protein
VSERKKQSLAVRITHAAQTLDIAPGDKAELFITLSGAMNQSACSGLRILVFNLRDPTCRSDRNIKIKISIQELSKRCDFCNMQR